MTAHDRDESSRSYRREWIAFATMSVGLFMAFLDLQIVASALPRIASALHTPLDELSWVQTGYLITEVIAIAMSGRLARAMSTRWLFAAATFGFSAASLGCALSGNFVALIIWRSLQGYAAGTIIPTVFAAGYKMFPERLKQRAILVAGGVTMLAPSIGPLVGGYIAEKLTWNWLFLVNLPIGVAIAAVVIALVRIDQADPRAWKTIDVTAFAALAIGLCCLQIVLKVGPEDRWTAPRDAVLIAVMLAGAAIFIRRSIGNREPLVDFAPFANVGFRTACAYNFVLGTALFGSLYLMPLFLGFVRFHTPLEIGLIMTVMGVAQLAVAPLATIADRRLPAQVVAFAGFAVFGAGALANAFQTPRTDFADLLWPQILRGVALLFCILPITNVALDTLPAAALANASGVLNFMRNIGGAVGIGLVDTIISVRPDAIGRNLIAELVKGDARTAAFVGVPVDLLRGVDIARADPADLLFVKPIVARAAATMAFNEAWILLAGILFVSLAMVPFLRRLPAVASVGLNATSRKASHDAASVLP